MTPITPDESLSVEEAVVVAVPMHGDQWGDVLVLRLTVGQVDALLALAAQIAQQQAIMTTPKAGVHVYALSADVYLAEARCWLPGDLSPDDLPEEGGLLRPAPAEPDAKAGSWSHDYRLYANGELEISGENGAAWATVYLPAIREQMG